MAPTVGHAARREHQRCDPDALLEREVLQLAGVRERQHRAGRRGRRRRRSAAARRRAARPSGSSTRWRRRARRRRPGRRRAISTRAGAGSRVATAVVIATTPTPSGVRPSAGRPRCRDPSRRRPSRRRPSGAPPRPAAARARRPGRRASRVSSVTRAAHGVAANVAERPRVGGVGDRVPREAERVDLAVERLGHAVAVQVGHDGLRAAAGGDAAEPGRGVRPRFARGIGAPPPLPDLSRVAHG